MYWAGGGGSNAFERDNSAFSKLCCFKNTENYCNYTRVARNFVHHCHPQFIYEYFSRFSEHSTENMSVYQLQ